MNKKIYIHKEDVWAHGPTHMSSASRDIFEHFYKAIKATFLNQFKDYQEVVGKIQNARNWADNCSLAFSEAALSKNKLNLPVYLEKSVILPPEHEFEGNSVLEVIDSNYDEKIYLDFEDFYNNANHGYIKSEKGREVCLRLYNCFIQEISSENLIYQLNGELSETQKWNTLSNKALIDYLNSKSNLSWHNWLLTYLNKYDVDVI